MILLTFNVTLEKKILFRCCHIDHVRAIHQHFHLLTLTTSTTPNMCCRKWCFGLCGRGPTLFTQDMDSHHNGLILLQWKNKWLAFSSTLLQNRHLLSFISTCRLCRYVCMYSSNLHLFVHIYMYINACKFCLCLYIFSVFLAVLIRCWKKFHIHVFWKKENTDRKRNCLRAILLIVILSHIFHFPAFPIYPDFIIKEFH